jgi:hypothetical protein
LYTLRYLYTLRKQLRNSPCGVLAMGIQYIVVLQMKEEKEMNLVAEIEHAILRVFEDGKPQIHRYQITSSKQIRNLSSDTIG